MSKIYKRVELVANIFIIVSALFLVGFIVQKYFFGESKASKENVRLQPSVGNKLQLADINWAQSPKSLVLALQTNCHFCNESAPFYKRVAELTQGKNIRLVAVFPTDAAEAKAHLSELGINGLEVIQSPLSSLQVSGTPTLLLTNDKGEITNFWIGKLSADRETEVINQINSN